MSTHPTSATGTRAAPARTLSIIRAAIVSGVVLLGVVFWQVRSATPVEPDPAFRRTFGLVALVMAIGFTGALYGVRLLRDRAATRATRVTLSILAWALGEGAAMIGLIYYFTTGAVDRAWPGLVVLALAVVLFPVPPDEG